MWDTNRRMLDEQDTALAGNSSDDGMDRTSLKTLLEKALQAPSNRSSPRLACISYRFIKAVKDIVLGDHLLDQLANALNQGKAP